MATLKETLEEFGDDEMIFIGSLSSFVFIGTREEFSQYGLIINDSLKDKAKETINSFRRTIKTICRMFNEFVLPEEQNAKRDDEEIERILRESKVAAEKLQQFKRERNKYLRNAYAVVKKLENSCKRYYRARDYYKNWKNIIDREVREVRPRTQLQDGTIILIEGNESGSFWDRKEFDRAIRYINAHGTLKGFRCPREDREECEDMREEDENV